MKQKLVYTNFCMFFLAWRVGVEQHICATVWYRIQENQQYCKNKTRQCEVVAMKFLKSYLTLEVYMHVSLFCVVYKKMKTPTTRWRTSEDRPPYVLSRRFKPYWFYI